MVRKQQLYAKKAVSCCLTNVSESENIKNINQRHFGDDCIENCPISSSSREIIE